MGLELVDPRDRFTAESSPVVQQPRFSSLPELEAGRHRYVVGSNGMFLEARSRVLRACVPLGPIPGLPFGEVKPSLEVIGGRQIPRDLLDEATRLARTALPNEWAGIIIFNDGRFDLIIPETLFASRDSINYSTAGIDPMTVVVDIHSHGNMPAFFSRTDDSDDRANPTPVFVATVLGRLRSPTPEIVSRLMVHTRPYHMTLLPMGDSQLVEPRNLEEEIA